MAIPRTAYRRYKVIDTLLRNKRRPYPTILDFQKACFEKLDVFPSEETIQKDIRNMRQPEPDGFEAPIVYNRLHKGYFYEDANFSLNSIRLNEDDLNSIKEAIELLQTIGNSKLSEKFNNALEKILISFKEEFPESNFKRKFIETEFISSSRGFEHFDLLFYSCKNRLPVVFSHFSYQKRKFKSLVIHPVLLKEFNNNWYVVGYSEFHNSIRTFGLDRIYEPIIVKKKFIETSQGIIDSYFKDVYGVYPIENCEKQKVEFYLPDILANYIESYPIHHSQFFIKFSKGKRLFTLDLIPSVELIRLLRSFGKQLVIKKPLWLVDEINK